MNAKNFRNRPQRAKQMTHFIYCIQIYRRIYKITKTFALLTVQLEETIFAEYGNNRSTIDSVWNRKKAWPSCYSVYSAVYVYRIYCIYIYVHLYIWYIIIYSCTIFTIFAL